MEGKREKNVYFQILCCFKHQWRNQTNTTKAHFAVSGMPAFLLNSCKNPLSIFECFHINGKALEAVKGKTQSVCFFTIKKIEKQCLKTLFTRIGYFSVLIFQDSPFLHCISLIYSKLHHFTKGTGAVTENSQEWTFPCYSHGGFTCI